MTVAIILAALALAIFLLKGKGSGKKSSAGKTGWQINYSPGMSGSPTLQGAGWYFDFPTIPSSHVHYVQWFSPPALKVGGNLVVRFAVTGGGFVPQEFPDRPALVSLLIQRRNDNWTAKGPMQSYRWYSAKAIPLSGGEFTLTVPLEVEHWGDIYGAQDKGLFADTLADVENIGLVFGSAGGRGHGVYATQPSKFELLSLEVV